MKFQSLLGAAAVVSLLVLAPTGETRAESVPLGPQEVQAMYSGKTWVWDAGAGYFAPNGMFQGFTRDREYGLMYATGRWSVELGGQLCYSARWYYRNTSTTSKDCFAHRSSNGAVLQRDERDGGQWYVHNLGRLRNGNLVAAQVPQLKGRLQQ